MGAESVTFCCSCKAAIGSLVAHEEHKVAGPLLQVTQLYSFDDAP